MNDIYAVRQTVCAMLTTRGYTVPPEVIRQTAEDVVHLYVLFPARLSIVAQCAADPTRLIAALFATVFSNGQFHCADRAPFV